MRPLPSLYCAVGDIGGATELVLFVKQIQEIHPDIKVTWFADGASNAKGASVLEKYGITPIIANPDPPDAYGATPTSWTSV